MIDPQAISLLGLGFLLGLKHALDTDHVVAVSIFAAERKRVRSSSLAGAFWGAGHTAALMIVSLLIISFSIRVPEQIGLWLELGVALMLIGLGANVLLKVLRGGVLHLHVHTHNNRLHIHPHVHESNEAHRHEQSADHHHSSRRSGGRPFLVGVVHGLAGSSALMLVVLTTIESKMLSVLYVAVFGLGSVGGMMAMTALLSVPFVLINHHRRLSGLLQSTAGAASVCVGGYLIYRIGILDGLFL